MIQRLFFLLVMFGLSGMYAQEITSPYHSKKIIVDRDSITIDSVSINTSFFKVLNSNQEPIDTSLYKIDYTKSILVFKNGSKIFLCAK